MEKYKQHMVKDVNTFSSKLPSDICASNISMSKSGEFAIHYVRNDNKCIIGFDGYGAYRYGLFRDGEYQEGEYIGIIDQDIPKDLLEYLQNFKVETKEIIL